MKCLLKQKLATGHVTVEDVNLKYHLQNPLHLPKDKLPLWRFCTLKEGAPLKADQTNYDTIHMLILEIDKGHTIQELEAKASEYSYAIHTTSSHTPEVNRFRLMLPLDMDYPDSFWREKLVKLALIRKFAQFDNSTFSNYQCIPALPANPADYYYNIHQGRRFGYDDIKQIVEELELDEKMDREMDAAFRASKSQGTGEINYEAYKAKVDKSTYDLVRGLPAHENGSRYNEFRSAMGKLLSNTYPDGEWIYSEHEIKTLLSAVYWDHDLHKALRSFVRRRK